MKAIILASSVALIASSALAQTPTRYYIQRNVPLKKCEVVQVQPKTGNKDLTQVGEDYESEDAAGRAIKLIKECTF
jgi:hypothetical protein